MPPEDTGHDTQCSQPCPQGLMSLAVGPGGTASSMGRQGDGVLPWPGRLVQVWAPPAHPPVPARVPSHLEQLQQGSCFLLTQVLNCSTSLVLH